MARTELISRAAAGLTPARAVSRDIDTQGLTGHYMGGSPWHWSGGSVASFLASCDHNRCASIWRQVQRYHLDTQGWNDVAYNSAVCPHGYRYEGRGPGVRSGANGSAHGNSISPAVLYLAGDDDPVTDEALWALIDEEERYGAEFRWPHDHWTSTSCPGVPFRTLIAAGVPAPDGAPAPRPQEWSDMATPQEIYDMAYRAAVDAHRAETRPLALVHDLGDGQLGDAIWQCWPDSGFRRHITSPAEVVYLQNAGQLGPVTPVHGWLLEQYTPVPPHAPTVQLPAIEDMLDALGYPSPEAVAEAVWDEARQRLAA